MTVHHAIKQTPVSLPPETPGPTGIHDQADPRWRGELGDTPGTLGVRDGAERQARAKFLAGGSKKTRKKKVHRGGGRTKVINVVTKFPNPWKNNIRAECAAIERKGWEPTSDDFAAGTSNSIEVEEFIRLTWVIAKQPAKSVSRVNIFTHSDPTLIAFKGTVRETSTTADVQLEQRGALTEEALENLSDGSWWRVKRRRGWKKFTMQQVQSRFTDDAKVYFYSCRSGINARMLQLFADKFKVTAVGFRDKICYCPKFPPSRSRIDRSVFGLGRDCSVAKVQKGGKFTALDAKGVARKPRP